MDDDGSSPPPQRERQPVNFRSTASTNWRLKDDSPRPEQPQRRGGGFSRSNDQRDSNSQDESAAGTRLYVGNLLYTAQKADIESLFTDQGFNVVNVSISTDPFTGRNPSYCFVDLASADEAQRAIAELNGIEVLGRNLRVSPGVAKRGQGQARTGDAGNREVRTKNYERGWAKESREERSEFTCDPATVF
jgi:RNA recognition motif-containing protein